MTTNIPPRKGFPQLMVHVAIWGILLFSPFLFTLGEAPNVRALLRFSLPVLFSLVVFYTNFLLLVDRYFFPRRYTVFVVANLLLIVACVLSMEYAKLVLPSGRGGDRLFSFFHVYRYSFTLLLTVGVSIGMRVLQQWRQTELLRKAQENEHLQSTLAHLRYQLQPHFFFNSLNNIYAFIDVSPEKAKDAIIRLSKLMRYLLYEANTDQAPLASEITFLKNYLGLMQIRLDERVRVRYSFPDVPPNLTIAPLLLIPLVENAFKHGVAAQQESDIQLDLRLTDRQLTLLLKNTNFPKDQTDQTGSGIGLLNLRQRLQLLYPDRHVLVQDIQGELFVTNLRIDL